MFGLFQKPPSRASKLSIDDVNLHIEELPGVIEVVDGLPRVHWSRLQQAVTPYRAHPALNQIWTELAAQWLGVIRRHVGERYQIYESCHLLLLSPQTLGEARRFLEVGDAAYQRLEHLLQRPALARGLGKHVVLVFQPASLYYDYIACYYPESDRVYGASGGIQISDGYRHTVLNGPSLRILVHELAHDRVSDRPLPLWLNEGLAQFAEDLVPEYRSLPIDPRQARLQRRYWSWFGIEHFWDGSAFVHSSSQSLSYQLADILFRNLATHPQRRCHLAAFLAAAQHSDAGQSACQRCFNCSLSQLVEEFLGPGDWAPD